MARRLTLSTVGIKSPLDIEADDEPGYPDAKVIPRRPVVRATRHKRSNRPRLPEAAELAALEPTVTDAPFNRKGRPVPTSIALDHKLASQLEETARAAGVSANGLAVAALQAGLPTDDDDAHKLVADERAKSVGCRSVELNLQLPKQLSARADALMRTIRRGAPRATQSDLINGALREGLPATPQLALTLVILTVDPPSLAQRFT